MVLNLNQAYTQNYVCFLVNQDILEPKKLQIRNIHGAFDDLKCNIIILDEDTGRLEIPSPEVAENISRWGTVKQGNSKASDETIP